jgi:hypothetical protein
LYVLFAGSAKNAKEMVFGNEKLINPFIVESHYDNPLHCLQNDKKLQSLLPPHLLLVEEPPTTLMLFVITSPQTGMLILCGKNQYMS